jgi:hypothetical protein
MKFENRKPGRPEVTDKAKSFTVCLKTSQRNTIIKKYGSIRKALESLL